MPPQWALDAAADKTMAAGYTKRIRCVRGANHDRGTAAATSAGLSMDKTM